MVCVLSTVSRETFDKLESGDRILFNDRKHPLRVRNTGKEDIEVEGPKGGRYVMFPAENDPEILLIAKRGSKRYASKVENLREVGEWQKPDKKTWKHSRSGRKIELVRNQAGFWSLETELDADIPRYGYSSKEFAVEEAEKLVRENPEG